MDKTTNAINWFEIPATDIARSKAFYETAFALQMEPVTMGDAEMAFFPWNPGSGMATGALVQSPNHKPSKEGSVVYLNGNPNLQAVLDRVESAGGTIAVPKMSIGEFGFVAFFVDTEGNYVGVHSTG